MTELKQGFYTALGTPLDEQGNLVEQGMTRQVELQLEAGAAGLLVMGSMGAEPGVRGAVYPEVARVAARAAKGAAPVFVGVMDNSVWRVKERIDALAGIPADGVVVTTPFYETYPDDLLVRYFTEIADASPFPVYLYDLMVLTKQKINFDMAVALSKHKNIRGIKTGDAVLARRLLRECPDLDVLFSGMDVFDVARAYGYPRVLDGMFACVPKTAKAFGQAFQAKNIAALGAALDKILSLRDLMAENGIWPGFTVAMNLLGCPGRYGYGFDVDPAPGEAERVAKMMAEMGEI